MKKITAVVRPEKAHEVMAELEQKGFPAVSRISILGRGKQHGLKVGETYYDELPKEMLMIVVEDQDCDTVVSVITKAAKTSGKGSYGDGKIFVSTVERAVTISTGKETL